MEEGTSALSEPSSRVEVQEEEEAVDHSSKAVIGEDQEAHRVVVAQMLREVDREQGHRVVEANKDRRDGRSPNEGRSTLNGAREQWITSLAREACGSQSQLAISCDTKTGAS